MRYKLKPGYKSLNGYVEIIDEDRLVYIAKNSNRGAIGIRTISKELLQEYVSYFEKNPESSPQEAREYLAGKSNIDKFEYGYTSTLTTLAKMVLGYELSPTDKKDATYDYSNANPTEGLQVIYYGAPGTGKSYTIDQKTTKDNSVRTTFHPDSDYASFVGAYKPTMEDVGIHYISDGEVKYAAGAENTKAKRGKHSGDEKKIVYKFVPQAFLKAYVEAWKRYAGKNNKTDSELSPMYGYNANLAERDGGENSIPPYYLIIEEINRGNCAQIFGDLFQLLDRDDSGSSSYPIHADEDIARFLKEDEDGFKNLEEEQRKIIANFSLKRGTKHEENVGEDILNGKLLVLPPNLHIWATMNTSDQSLFPIDSAFKRRWDWEYMPIDYNPKYKSTGEPLNWKFEIGESLYDWGKFIKIVNAIILKETESPDKQLGYFFVKPDKQKDGMSVISEKKFVNKVLNYILNDALKDYDLKQKPFVFEKTEDNGARTTRTFIFTNFFPIEKNEYLLKFKKGLEELNLEPYNPDEHSGKKTNLTVTFPNGDVVKEPTLTDTYIETLKKLGLDRVYEILKDEKRSDEVMMTTENIDVSAKSPLRYRKADDYYILLGAFDYGSILRNLSSKLNADLIINNEAAD